MDYFKYHLKNKNSNKKKLNKKQAEKLIKKHHGFLEGALRES